MKKIICCIVALLYITGFAYAETDITFANIPWLANDSEVFQSLSEAGMIREGETGLSFTNNNPIYIIADDNGFITPDRIAGLELVSFSADLSGKVKGKIAGYPIKKISLSFAYDGEYRLIAVEIELIKASYTDIKTKLTKKYGEGEAKETEEGNTSVVWRGENNSGIILFSQDGGLSYSLVYGRLDAEELLHNCLNSDSDDLTGL